MFFRRTKVANGLDGKSYYTYRLVENQREGTKFRQKTVLNLGANQGVPQSDWKAVAQRVEAIQHGQISCFEYPKRIESAAQSVVKPKFSSWSLIPASLGRFFTQYQSVENRLFTQSASPNGLAIVELTRQSYCFNIKNLTELCLAPTAEFRLNGCGHGT